MIPVPAVWWLLGHMIRLLCVAISLQAFRLLVSAHTWHDRGFLALMVMPGLFILIAWFRRGSCAVRRLYRKVRA